MTSQVFTDAVTLTAASWFNDVDTAAYGALTSLTGQNTLAATGPASMTAYAVGQSFRFIPVSTNTVSTTLNITANAVALGAKNVFFNGAALTGNEITAGVPCTVVYDGTQFNLSGLSVGTRLSTALGSDVALSTTANYFDGPSVAQGSVGLWQVSGTITYTDTGGGANVHSKLWDGTTVIASASQNVASATSIHSISLSGFITSPAGNLRISARDATTTNGTLKFNATGNSKDCTIFAVRIG